MQSRSRWLVVPILLMFGCALPVRDDEIEWRFPLLSRQNCPDLSGKYLEGQSISAMTQCPSYRTCDDAQGLFVLITGGVTQPLQGVTIEDAKPLPRATSNSQSRNTYVTSVMHVPNGIEVELLDSLENRYSRAKVSMNHERIGCHDGALIIRNLANITGVESGHGEVQYSETSIRRASNGGLIAERWSSRRLRSNLTGKAFGEVRDAERRGWQLMPVPDART